MARPSTRAGVALDLTDDFSRRLDRPRRAIERFGRQFAVIQGVGTASFRALAVSAAASTTALRRGLPAVTAFTRGLGLANTATLGLLGSNRRLTGLLAAGFLGASIREFGKLESSVVRTGIASKEFADRAGEIDAAQRRIGKSAGIARTALQQETELLAKAGFGVDDALAILENGVKVSLATGADLTEVIHVLSTTMRVYGLEARHVTAITDVFFKSANEGKIDLEGFSASIGKTSGQAKRAGLPLESLAAAMAAITNAGQGTEEAAITLNRLIGLILDGLPPESELADRFPNLAELLNVNQLRRDLASDPVQGLVTFLRRLKAEIPDESIFNQIFPEERARRAASALFANDLKELSRILNEVDRSAGTTNEGFARMANTIEKRSRDVFASFRDLMLEVGQAVAPAFAPGADSLADAIDRISQSIQDNRAEIGLGLIEFRGFVRELVSSAQQIAGRDGFPAALQFAGEQGVNLLISALVAGIPFVVEVAKQAGGVFVPAFLKGISDGLKSALDVKRAGKSVLEALGLDKLAREIDLIFPRAPDSNETPFLNALFGTEEDRKKSLKAAADKMIDDFSAELKSRRGETEKSFGVQINVDAERLVTAAEKLAFLRSQLNESAREELDIGSSIRHLASDTADGLGKQLDFAKELLAKQKEQEKAQAKITEEVAATAGAATDRVPRPDPVSDEANAREALTKAIKTQQKALQDLDRVRDRSQRKLAEIRQLESAGVITAEEALRREAEATAGLAAGIDAARSAIDSLQASADGFTDTALDVRKLREEIENLSDALGPQGAEFEFLRELEAFDRRVREIEQGLRIQDFGASQADKRLQLGQLSVNEFRAQINAAQAQTLALVDKQIAELDTLRATAIGSTSPALAELLLRLQEIRAEYSTPVAAAGEGTDFFGSLSNNLQLAAEDLGNFQALSSDLAGTLTGAFDGALDSILGLNAGFKQFAAEFLIDIGRMILRALFFKAILSLIGLSGGGEVPAVAGSGLNRGGVAGRHGRKVPMRFGFGGDVPGPGINADVIPAMLTPREIVIQRKIAMKYRDALLALNAGVSPEKAFGFGEIGKAADRMQRIAMAGRYESGGEATAVAGRGAGVTQTVVMNDPQSADRLVAQGGRAIKEWFVANQPFVRSTLGLRR